MSDDGDDVVENLAAALGYEAERADHEKIIDLADRRPPVVYSVTITEGWDGYLAVEVHHVQGWVPPQGQGRHQGPSVREPGGRGVEPVVPAQGPGLGVEP